MTAIKPRKSEAETIQPIDGGWGWVVVACIFFIRFMSFGTLQSIGVAFDVLMAELKCSKSEIGVAASISLSLQLFAAPVASILQNRFGTRPVVLAGTFAISLSFLSSAFAPNVFYLYFSFGVLGGIGMALIYLPVFVIISYYFKKRRTLATALGGIGVYTGCFFHPYLMRFIISYYGWRGAFITLGALTLNSIPAALLLRVYSSNSNKRQSNGPEKAAEKAHNDDSSPTVEDSDEKIELAQVDDDNKITEQTVDDDGERMTDDESGMSKKNPPFIRRIIDYVKDFVAFFKNLHFTAFWISNLLVLFVYYLPALFINDYGKTVGIPPERTVILQSLIGPGNMIGRPLIALFGDRFASRRNELYSGLLIASGIITVIATYFQSFYFMAFFVLQFAFFVGSTQAMLTPILGEIVALDNLGFAFGVLLVSQGLGTLIGPPILVLLPTYALTFTSAGFILMASGAVMFVPICLKCYYSKKTTSKSDNK